MTWPRVFFRLGVVLGTFLAAVAVPDLGALIALLGALTGSILSLIAPALINRRCPRERWMGVRRGRNDDCHWCRRRNAGHVPGLP